MALSKDSKKLLETLRLLHEELRFESHQKFNRINPFTEDLFSWKERGKFWFGFDKNISIYNSTIIIGDVEIGRDTWIGPNCAIDGSGGLIIGEFCSISSGVQIVTHDTVKWALSGGKQPYERAPIQIGSYCFIGTYAVITKGVSIGNHCLVAASAVVTCDFPDYSIIGGVPAKLIGKVKLSDDGIPSLEFFNGKK